MTTEFESRVMRIINDLEERIQFLERELNDAQETIREHEVTIGQHNEEFAAYRCEIDELAANVDCIIEDEKYG
jgi:chromosome segregation ATPase